MKRQIISNLGSNYLNKLLTMALAFFIVPFLTYKLSSEVFGITVLAESTILFFGIVTNSMKISMTRFATYAFSEGKREEFIAYLSTGRFLLIGCSVAALLFGGAISLFYPYMIKISPAYLSDTQLLFFLITIGFTISIPNIVFSSMVWAKQRPDLINLAMTCGAVLKAVLILIVYSVFPVQSMLPYGVIYVVAMAVQNGIIYVIYRKLFPNTKIQMVHFKKEKAKEILSFGLHSSAGQVSELLYDNTALVIIGFIWGPVFVAIYSISVKFAMILKRLFMEGSWALIPTFVDLVARKHITKAHNLFLMYTKVMTLINTPLCIVLIFMAKPLIVLWVGPDYISSAGLLPIHVMPLFMAIPFAVCSCMTCAYGKIKIPSLVSLGMAIANVFFGLLFALVFSWGLPGIAIGAALSSIIYLTVFLPYYACRISGFPLPKYIYEGWLKPFVLAWIFFGGGFWCLNAFHIEWAVSAKAIFFFAFVSFMYAVLSFILILNSFERGRLQAVFEKIRLHIKLFDPHCVRS